MFGPLCHLVQRKERLRALSEAYRVLRPRGWIFAAAISRFTSALDGSLNGFIRDPAFMKIMKQDLKNGQYRNPHNVPQYFTTTFHHPEELQAEIHRAGFNSVKACALTGFAWLLPNLKEYSRNPKLRKRLLTILETLEQEPSMMGVSDHLLVAARKPLA